MYLTKHQHFDESRIKRGLVVNEWNFFLVFAPRITREVIIILTQINENVIQFAPLLLTKDDVDNFVDIITFLILFVVC